MSLAPRPIAAHGFGHHQMIDLSLPQHLYIFSAVIAIILSFVLVAFFLQSYQSHFMQKQKILPFSLHKYIPFARWCVIAVVLFAVFEGWKGTQTIEMIIVPNLIWVIFNVGFVYFTMLFGNIWSALHPFAHFRFLQVKRLSWNNSVGAWPAVLLFFGYRWIENIFPLGGVPHILSWCIVFYFALSCIAMYFWSAKTWLQYGDPFGVFFRLIGHFSVANTQEKKLLLRWPGSALLRVRAMHFSEVAFVMLMLGTIAFDGLKETQLWQSFLDVLSGGSQTTLLTKTYGMAIVILGMFVMYLLTCLISEMASARDGRHPLPFLEYAYALLPIAVGYEIAHYFFFFLSEWQTFLVLISDPLGTGVNVFGTAHNTVLYDILSPETLWNMQMAVIVLGHVLSVYVAHSIALHIYRHRWMALRSQLPMLLLMIGYTIFSLWTITLPTVITVE